jgi:site-specific DNA recombinase
MKTIAYLRLSTSEDRQRNSFEAQLDAIKIIAKPDEIIRETISGAADLERRPALLEAIATLKAGDRLIVQRYDRLARDTEKAGWLAYEIERRGASLISATEASESAEARLVRTILASFAAHEKTMIRARIRAALDQKRKRGEKLGGYAPYGYVVGVAGRLAPYPAEQKILREIRALEKKGLKSREIAAILNDRGVPSKTGRRWSIAAINRICARLSRERDRDLGLDRLDREAQ